MKTPPASASGLSHSDCYLHVLAITLERQRKCLATNQQADQKIFTMPEFFILGMLQQKTVSGEHLIVYLQQCPSILLI